jgi:hypothetical protein
MQPAAVSARLARDSNVASLPVYGCLIVRECKTWFTFEGFRDKGPLQSGTS